MGEGFGTLIFSYIRTSIWPIAVGSNFYEGFCGYFLFWLQGDVVTKVAFSYLGFFFFARVVKININIYMQCPQVAEIDRCEHLRYH